MASFAEAEADFERASFYLTIVETMCEKLEIEDTAVYHNFCYFCFSVNSLCTDIKDDIIAGNKKESWKKVLFSNHTLVEVTPGLPQFSFSNLKILSEAKKIVCRTVYIIMKNLDNELSPILALIKRLENELMHVQTTSDRLTEHIYYGIMLRLLGLTAVAYWKLEKKTIAKQKAIEFIQNCNSPYFKNCHRFTLNVANAVLMLLISEGMPNETISLLRQLQSYSAPWKLLSCITVKVSTILQEKYSIQWSIDSNGKLSYIKMY